MKELSRVELFSWILSVENEETDISLVRDSMKRSLGDYKDTFIKTIRLNIQILKGIELFFIPDENKTDSDLSLDEFQKIYKKNIEGEKLKKQYKLFPDKIIESENSRYAFNRLIKFLNRENSKLLQDLYSSINNGDTEMNKEKPFLNKVFLSYAYIDKMYTLCLYFYMLSHNVNLYIDWLCSSGLKNGIEIKNNLSKELIKSNQFLFLRSPTSELRIRGNNDIRGWCSWEMGMFYHMNLNGSSNKYYIDMYSNENDKKASNKSEQLDGLTRLTSVHLGKLHG